MDFLEFHFRCELTLSSSVGVESFDVSGFVLIRTYSSMEGKRICLEFLGEATEERFQELWKLLCKREEVISATMYDWDALDQHPGERRIFNRNINKHSTIQS
jgi:hypothetical protein